MDRLTEKTWANLDPWECCGQDGYCTRPSNKPGGCRQGCIVPKLYIRLAKYEDIGLTPEEVSTVKLALMGKCVAEIKEFEGIPINRLCELAEADKDGRLDVLPCQVDDIVFLYDPQYPRRGETNLPLLRCRVSEFSNDGSRTCMVLDIEEKWGTMRRFTAVEIEKYGKVVFRTEAEAIAALAKE